MPASGTAVVNFGAFPGTDQASVTITGQTGIVSTSHPEAEIDPSQGATTDHSVGEHIAADLDVRCETIVSGTGFTITASVRDRLHYGAFNVFWVWGP